MKIACMEGKRGLDEGGWRLGDKAVGFYPVVAAVVVVSSLCSAGQPRAGLFNPQIAFLTNSHALSGSITTTQHHRPRRRRVSLFPPTFLANSRCVPSRKHLLQSSGKPPPLPHPQGHLRHTPADLTYVGPVRLIFCALQVVTLQVVTLQGSRWREDNF